ncbi:hypothetical protein FY528_04885 [Hymenobacter lutimineralis]|uniref:Uncharacterized protein n=1 Tax=Hymenobacter lutimineralis TaxID=2606448 RepID=A0A5D6VBR2_9BACT|nr:hypothetical protein [Hymenobacter lutimineralis]TYZ12632.1 hypothetical protein FY528_04885 [Hymenobacter lutimineralis]
MKRRYQKAAEPASLKATDILYSLTRSAAVLRRLQTLEGKPYSALARALLPWVGSEKRPTAKLLQQQLGVSAGVLGRWLQLCYADLLALLETDASVLSAGPVEHWLYVHGQRRTVEVRCRLPVTPRLHEQVELPLIAAEAGNSQFYVQTITYELVNDQLVVHIALKPGYYNAYVERLLERALFEEELSIHELLDLSRYQLEDRLRELYPRG